MEEVIQGEAERHAGNLLLGRDQKFDLGEAANSFLMGGAMGGLFGAVQTGAQAIDAKLAGRGTQGTQQIQTNTEGLQGAEHATQMQDSSTPLNKTEGVPIQSEGVTAGLQAQTEAGTGAVPDASSITADTFNRTAGLDLNALAEERMGKPLSQLTDSEAQTLQAIADGQGS